MDKCKTSLPIFKKLFQNLCILILLDAPDKSDTFSFQILFCIWLYGYCGGCISSLQILGVLGRKKEKEKKDELKRKEGSYEHLWPSQHMHKS